MPPAGVNARALACCSYARPEEIRTPAVRLAVCVNFAPCPSGPRGRQIVERLADLFTAITVLHDRICAATHRVLVLVEFLPVSRLLGLLPIVRALDVVISGPSSHDQCRCPHIQKNGSGIDDQTNPEGHASETTVCAPPGKHIIPQQKQRPCDHGAGGPCPRPAPHRARRGTLACLALLGPVSLAWR